MSRSNDIAGLTTSILDGVTAAEVGLGNVDNTSDANKPVSTAQQTALDAKLATTTASSTYAPLASPTFTGDTTINSGNFVIGTAGKGIDFSAQTTSAVSGTSVNAEVLDHYERGTWTPDLQASSDPQPSRSAGASNGGVYVKVGNIVHISGEMKVVVSSGSYSGVLKMTGLPFTVNKQGAVAVSYYAGWSLGSNYGLTLWTYENQTFCYIFHNTSGTTDPTQLNDGNRSGTTQTIIFGGSYYTN